MTWSQREGGNPGAGSDDQDGGALKRGRSAGGRFLDFTGIATGLINYRRLTKWRDAEPPPRACDALLVRHLWICDDRPAGRGDYVVITSPVPHHKLEVITS